MPAGYKVLRNKGHGALLQGDRIRHRVLSFGIGPLGSGLFITGSGLVADGGVTGFLV